MYSDLSPPTVFASIVLAALFAGCGVATPPPPVTPAGVALPPEVELSPEEAAAQFRPPQPAGYR
jgi:hypothetical protein